jgi:hypothetical protein
MAEQPVIYRVGFWQVFEGRYSSLVWLFLGLFGALIGLILGGLRGELIVLGAGAVLAAFGVHFAVSRRTLELWPDHIVIKGPLGERNMACRDLKGFRRPFPRWVWLEAQPPGKGVLIRQARPGDALGVWLESIPDLFAADSEGDLEAFLADPAYGDTANARQARLDRWTRRLKSFNIAGFGLTFILLLWDFPPAWLLLLGALSPPLAVILVLASRGVATLQPPSPSPRPTAAGLLLPGAALIFRALMDFNFVGGARFSAATLVLWILLAGVLLLVDRKALGSPRALVVLVAAALAYGWGSALAADVDLDAARATTYRATVLDLKASGTRHVSYYATLSAWGPYPTGHELKISHDQYYVLDQGQAVCPRLHPGAFGAPWVEVTTCQAAP